MRIFLFLCGLLSSISIVAVEPESRYILDIQRAYSTEDYQLIRVGELQIAVIQHAADTASVKGAALLISDMSHAPGKELIELSQQLNTSGWITLMMAAPNTRSFDNMPTMEQLDDEQQQNIYGLIKMDNFIDQDVFDQIEARLRQQMLSLQQQSSQYPGFKLVIAQGTAAAWLAKLYSEQNLERPDGFVALGPYWPQKTLNKQIGQYLANSGTPVLDMYSERDNSWTRNTVHQRKVAANKAFKVQYRQRELPMFPAQSPQLTAYVSREILGWLKYMGW